MQIVLVGVDHVSAPIALREQLSCTQRQIPQILHQIHDIAQECVLLSTCNRVEIYAVFSEVEEGHLQLLRILSDMSGITLSELENYSNIFIDEEAVSHLYGVACGIYSLVPGESQIQGQVVEALEVAQSCGYAGPITSALFRGAVVAGKRARNETAIGRNAASVSFAAVQLAKKLFPALNTSRVLLVGSGKMSELAAHHLCDNGAQELIIINRTSSRAIDLAKRFGARHRTYKELVSSLVEADVIISSTSAPRAIITLETMQEVMKLRAGRKILLIDIALPRDIEPTVADIPGVHLYNLDDLRIAVNEGVRLRNQEVEQVQKIIHAEVSAFQKWIWSLNVVETINALRQHVDTLRQQELNRTLQRLPGLTQRETAIVQELTTRLVNKLLHVPTLRLKEATAEGQEHIYTEALHYLFDLKEHSDEKNYNRNSGEQTGHDTDAMGGRTSAPAKSKVRDHH
ncbi:MAG TPA: glutamyl-tRNA reductase [Ktedonobacteraceae bacterium]|nr:glutamyl-tRNA reductase [Ktedonobacteraceae bacterium]